MFFGLGSVLGQICEKMEYGKRVEKGVEKESTGWEVGGRGGGQRRGGRLRLAALQGVCTIVQHALLPLNEVRRISVACGEFRPRRLKQNPTVVKQKSIISDAREGHF